MEHHGNHHDHHQMMIRDFKRRFWCFAQPDGWGCPDEPEHNSRRYQRPAVKKNFLNIQIGIQIFF